MPECALAVLPAVLQALAPGPPEAAAAATEGDVFFYSSVCGRRAAEMHQAKPKAGGRSVLAWTVRE